MAVRVSFCHHVVVEMTFKANGEDVEVECDAGENLFEVAVGNDVEVKSAIHCVSLMDRQLQRWWHLR